MEKKKNQEVKSNKRKTMEIRRMLKKKEVSKRNLHRRPTEVIVL